MSEQEGPSRWLTPSEKAAWTGAASFILLLPGRLDADLQRAAGMTLFEYLTSSHLSEAPERRLVLSELAFLANGSLSRLSNVLKRFEARGWVERRPHHNDRRATLAVLTAAGLAKVTEAAPIHVTSVREHVLNRLTDSDQRALARISAKLRDPGDPLG